MKFNIYGRFQLEVRRANDSWEAYRLEGGKRRSVDDFVIPSTFDEAEIATYLDDLYHELSGPGQRIEVIL
ncbi:hypothetical protein Q4S45_19520 [Massilia sp. R2A-15]|uniref:DUF7661 family protein n=1 Tax=Massilia sp. R2A-15 TaxID=3064278 RepID=UPI0027373B2B|nr:hypothetical protein [Massilia sp. R2A-15]WLI88868.1 hypothetical protein Q4S45_19520 [Massilia sp. R2A-15]